MAVAGHEQVGVDVAQRVVRPVADDDVDIRPGRPRDLIVELGLELVRDASRLELWCRAALEGQERVVDDVKAGKTKAVGALIGRVKKAADGMAVDAREVQAMLLRLIEEMD